VLTVYYRPQNPTYAQLGRPDPPTGFGLLVVVSLFAIIGLALLAAAVIHMVMAAQDRWYTRTRRKAALSPWPGSHGRSSPCFTSG
jgi:hypothetical protein